MLPPNHLYSANVHNKTDKEVSVTVHYSSPDKNDSKTETIQAGASHLFPEVTYQASESHTNIVPVQKIVVKSDSNDAEHTHNVTVQGVNRVKDFHVTGGDNGLSVSQQ